MALFNKEDHEDGNTMQSYQSSAQSSSSGAGHTIIGSTVRVEGTLESSENITINGEFKGTITTTKNLAVGEQANVEADLNAATIVVAGVVKGNVTAKGDVQLKSSAHVEGDIHAGSIAIDSGASLSGQIATIKSTTVNDPVKPANANATSTTTSSSSAS